MVKRLFTPGRWNWSQRAGKWLYVEINKDGKRKYHYQIEPPQEFIDLTLKMKKLNEKLLQTIDPVENSKIFSVLMEVSRKMQDMGKSC